MTIYLKLFKFILTEVRGLENIASSGLFWPCVITKIITKLLLKCFSHCGFSVSLFQALVKLNLPVQLEWSLKIFHKIEVFT